MIYAYNLQDPYIVHDAIVGAPIYVSNNDSWCGFDNNELYDFEFNILIDDTICVILDDFIYNVVIRDDFVIDNVYVINEWNDFMDDIYNSNGYIVAKKNKDFIIMLQVYYSGIYIVLYNDFGFSINRDISLVDYTFDKLSETVRGMCLEAGL